jgi:hypothetical protein
MRKTIIALVTFILCLLAVAFLDVRTIGIAVLVFGVLTLFNK